MQNKLFKIIQLFVMICLMALGTQAYASEHDCETRDQLQNGILKDKYKYINCFTEDLAAVSQDDGSPNGIYGFINKQGELVIPMQYSYTRGFYDGLAAVRKGDNQYYIDKSGKIVIDVSQYRMVWNFENGVAAVDKIDERIHAFAPHMAHAQSCIDKTGKLLLPLIYTSIDCQALRENHQVTAMKATPNGFSMGVVDKENRIIIPFDYTYLEKQANGLYIGMKNCQGFMHIGVIGECRFGVIDEKNKIIVPFDYNRIDDFKNGLAVVVKGKKWGLVNEKGQIVRKLSEKPHKGYSPIIR